MLTTFFSWFRFQKTRNNEERNIAKEPASKLVLESIQALEKRTEKVNEENQQKFDQQSDRLQSMEASISKILKLNETAPKSNDASKKAQSHEPTVQNNNTTNVASKTVKRFRLTHVFANVHEFKENVSNYSEWKTHYNVKWCVSVKRHNNHLGFFVHCEPITPADNFSLRAKLEFKVVGSQQNDVIRTWEICYEKVLGYGFRQFLNWEEIEKWYLVNGNLTVKVHGEIVETTGFAKEKIRMFDESQKDVSDVILAVRDTKFYVSKMYLASQSSVFKVLLFGKFSESKQSEVTLNGTDPDDFHYFLEVLYGESQLMVMKFEGQLFFQPLNIPDANVEDIALLADMYDTPTAIRKWEEFLLRESKKAVVTKLEIATQYNLENLKEWCKSQTP